MKAKDMWSSLSCANVTAVTTHLCETWCLGEQILLLLSALEPSGSHWKRTGPVPAHCLCILQYWKWKQQQQKNKTKNQQKISKSPQNLWSHRRSKSGIPKILDFKSDPTADHSVLHLVHLLCVQDASASGQLQLLLAGDKELSGS